MQINNNPLQTNNNPLHSNKNSLHSDNLLQISPKPRAIALLPLVVFLGIYLVGSVVAGDFYKIPITVAGMIASVVAVMMMRGMTLTERVDSYSRGATEPNIMLMIWIFVLAGAFAASTKQMGAVDATVALTMRIVPAKFLPAGMFLAACFTSLSVGTSVGTIVALTPIASALAQQMGGNLTAEQAIAREDSLLEAKYPEFGRLMKEYYEGLLFFEISNREVWKSEDNTDEARAKFFKKNKKKYKFDSPRFKGAVVRAATQEVLDSAKRHLAGKNIDEYRSVVEKYFMNDSARVIRLELGVFAIGDNKWVDKLAFGQGAGGSVMKDLPYVDVVGKEITAPEAYTDVKAAVADDFNKYKEQKWVKKLRKKYKVEVNKEVLKTVNNHD